MSKIESINLLLSATRSSWSVSTLHGTEFEKSRRLPDDLKKKVFERDDYTCRGCQFRSKRFQEITNLNDDHSDFSFDNLATLCPLCHQVFHLPAAATTLGGEIIFLSSISQAELNRLCIVLFAIQSANPKPRYTGIARSLYGGLQSNKNFVVERLGSSDPGALAQILINMSPGDYLRREEFIKHLRLLPNLNRFKKQAEYWATNVFKNFEENEMEKILKKLDLDKLKE